MAYYCYELFSGGGVVRSRVESILLKALPSLPAVQDVTFCRSKWYIEGFIFVRNGSI